MLQETPFSAYLTIRKSFVKNLHSSNLFPTFNDSEETLKKKISALETENSCLKSDIHDYKTELKDAEDIVMKLEEKVKNAEIKIIKYSQESKKVEKQLGKVEDILVEKDKEIFKLKTISNNLNDDNTRTRENLRNITNSLKISEKETLKAKNKCDNLESTVAKLKSEKGSLQKTLKKIEKSKNKEPSKQIKNMETFHPKTKNHEDAEPKNYYSEEKDTTNNPIAYNIPVSPNPFELLDNNNIFDSNIAKSDFGTNSKSALEKEDKDEPLEKKRNLMSQEQERRVLKQIEKIMLGKSEIT